MLRNRRAFPRGETDNQFGMTLHQWLVGQAIVGIAARPRPTEGLMPTNDENAQEAINLADAIISKLENP